MSTQIPDDAIIVIRSIFQELAMANVRICAALAVIPDEPDSAVVDRLRNRIADVYTEEDEASPMAMLYALAQAFMGLTDELHTTRDRYQR